VINFQACKTLEGTVSS